MTPIFYYVMTVWLGPSEPSSENLHLHKFYMFRRIRCPRMFFSTHLTLEYEAPTQSQNVGHQTPSDRPQYPRRTKILTLDITILNAIKISKLFILTT
jgi:hypothetical protein